MKSACLMALALLALPASAQQTGPGGADPRALFSIDDYPAGALRRKEQGTVRARLTVGADGRVKACKVIQSSLSPELDTATCTIMMRRARFQPARDANGHPVEDTVVTPPITWVIAATPAAAAAGVAMQLTQPGRYHCAAPAGRRVNQELVPLRAGQELRLAMRLAGDAAGATHPGTAGVILVGPKGRSIVVVGRAIYDPFKMYTAIETPSVPVQRVIYEYPITKGWIIVKLSVDDHGFLTVRGGDLAKTYPMGSAEVTHMVIQCTGAEWDIDVWPRSFVP